MSENRDAAQPIHEPTAPVLKRKRSSHAQVLGRRGGKKSGAMRTPAQIAARRKNMEKARATVEANRQTRPKPAKTRVRCPECRKRPFIDPALTAWTCAGCGRTWQRATDRDGWEGPKTPAPTITHDVTPAERLNRLQRIRRR